MRFVSNLLRQFFCQSCSISDVENHNHYTETSEKYTKLSWVQTSAKEYVLLCNVKLTCNIEIKLVTKIIGIIVLTLTVWYPANNSKLAIFLHIANRGRRNNIPGFSVLVLVCFISFFYLYVLLVYALPLQSMRNNKWIGQKTDCPKIQPIDPCHTPLTRPTPPFHTFHEHSPTIVWVILLTDR